uniref:N-acetyl-D-glucosamine kinase n=1 Tax=Quercus lobata TaxID=97700 RepID=A0A7N2LSZ3_QUELO
MKNSLLNGDEVHENGGCDDDDVVLGVDGGTTSTVCVCMPLLPLISSQNLPNPLPILARAVAGSSNHNSVGESASKDTLEKVMSEALSKSGSNWSAVRAVCLGVSGVNHPTDQDRIIHWLRDIFPSHVKLYVHNDALAALASGTMGKLHGCVLIAGTGSISYGFSKDGREARAAGAGPVLGDWGRLHSRKSSCIHSFSCLSIPLVAWDKVCLLFECGDLGIQRVGLFNKALLGKWLRRFEGSRSWNLLFRHGPQDWEAATVYSFFEFIYSSMPRGEGDDQLLWRFTTSGVFDVHSFYKLLFGPHTDAIPWECIWCTKMPKRVSIFLWIAANDGILTIDNLVKRVGSAEVSQLFFLYLEKLVWKASFNHLAYGLDMFNVVSLAGIGYGIAAQALTAVVRAHDGRGPQTALTDCILKALSLSSPDELIGWTYADPSWARIAALVPDVVSCAESGDQIAHKILADAVQELALSVKAVVQRLSLCGADGNGSFPVVMVGGVLEANKSWDIGKEVINCIQRHYPGAYPVRPEVEPAVGAALLAWNFLMKESERHHNS